MATFQIQPERVRALNEKANVQGDYVLYWMQQAQRAEFNHALEFAIQQANDLGQRLLVMFGLMHGYPEANLRHYAFMLEGLRETREALGRRGIKMVVRKGEPAEVAIETGRKASLIVCDKGYLRHQREWRDEVARAARCRVVEVNSDAIVPVEVASDKAEYAARTVRPKLNRHKQDFLVKLRTTALSKDSLGLRETGLGIANPLHVLEKMDIDVSVKPVSDLFPGGTREARHRLKVFIARKLAAYDAKRTDLVQPAVSCLSPYLHFGQISPVYVALEVLAAEDIPRSARDSFIEELLVRRELAMNYVYYTRDYDKFPSLPDWTRKTLAKHKEDKRPQTYSRGELEHGKTHDRYWNAAMREMRDTGYLHNHLRMYWGKKILEWGVAPEEAFKTALALNNKYFLDGRDPNSYANVAWVFGLHDRPWKERPIFGTVRYMSASGLERKCDMEAYLDRIRGY